MWVAVATGVAVSVGVLGFVAVAVGSTGQLFNALLTPLMSWAMSTWPCEF